MTHTPGPWRVTPEMIVIDSKGNEVAYVSVAAQLLEAKYNIQLIAAAPDLLAASQAYLADNSVTNRAKLRAAIAKATGES